MCLQKGELVLTAKLIAHQRERWRCHFSAAARILAEAAEALDRLDQPDFLPGVIRLVSAHYCARFRYGEHIPSTTLFSEGNGGLFVAFSLLASADGKNATPTGGAVRFDFRVGTQHRRIAGACHQTGERF